MLRWLLLAFLSLTNSPKTICLMSVIAKQFSAHAATLCIKQAVIFFKYAEVYINLQYLYFDQMLVLSWTPPQDVIIPTTRHHWMSFQTTCVN